MKQPLLKAGTVATIVHTLYPENNIKMCYSASFIRFLRQIAGLDWTAWTGMDWQDSSTTMEHACSRIQSYISKQLLLEAPGMLHTL